MQSEPVQASPCAQLIPAPVDVAPLDRCPDGGREDEPVFPPSVAQREPLGAPSRAAARCADAPHRPQHASRRNAPWVTRARIARAGPSSVKGTPRSFLTAPQK